MRNFLPSNLDLMVPDVSISLQYLQVKLSGHLLARDFPCSSGACWSPIMVGLGIDIWALTRWSLGSLFPKMTSVLWITLVPGEPSKSQFWWIVSLKELSVWWNCVTATTLLSSVWVSRGHWWLQQQLSVHGSGSLSGLLKLWQWGSLFSGNRWQRQSYKL